MLFCISITQTLREIQGHTRIYIGAYVGIFEISEGILKMLRIYREREREREREGRKINSKKVNIQANKTDYKI